MGNQGRGQWRRLLAGGAVSLLGLGALAVPLYDIWDDVAHLEWALVATLAENSVMLVIALSLFTGGIWLASSGWKPRRATTVAKVTLGGTLLVAALFVWIVSTQLWAMHRIKPYVVVLDGVVIGAAATFGAGIYKARRDERAAALARQRDWFSGLFQNTTDAVAAIEGSRNGELSTEVNEAFESTFGHDPDGVLDTAVERIDRVDDRAELLRRAYDGESFETELDWEVDGERRHFVFRLVPHDSQTGPGYLYVVVTDITDQAQLARAQATTEQMEALHDVASELESATGMAELHDLAMQAVDRTIDARYARFVHDGVTVAEQRFDGSDGEADGDGTDHETVTVDIDDSRLEVCAASFDHQKRKTLDLLATHLERTTTRLEREAELQDERDQLEFVNRTLRHNLLNDLQVVQARLEMLDPDSSDFDHHEQVVRDHVEDMSEFVDTMRTYMNQIVESEEHSLEPRDLRDAVTPVVSRTDRSHEDAVVTVEELPAISVRADDLLGPMFENVVTNAIEHNDRAEPHVWISGEVEDDTVTVRIADDGPGIPEDRREAIFERGNLGVESTGTGFGLYLVDQAIDTYDGDLTIRDRDPRGTVFDLTLPLAEDHAAEAEADTPA